MKSIAITTALAAALSAATACHAVAKEPRARPPAPAQTGSRFYPQEIEGGVSGNFAFNNQIRKLRDPLNANGGR